MQKILIVDDNKYIRFALSAIVEEAGYKAITVGEGGKVLNEINSSKPDLVILDKKLPEHDGIDLLREIKKVYRDLPVIILTAYGDENSAIEAHKLGALAFMTKPFNNAEIIALIRKTLQY